MTGKISGGNIDETYIEALIHQRIVHRQNRNYGAADEIKKLLELNDIVITDLPFKDGGLSTWRHRIPLIPEVDLPGKGVMESVRDVVRLAGSGNQDVIPDVLQCCKARLHALVALISQNTMDRARHQYQHEMQGRKFADAAFELARVGVEDTELFDLLTEGAVLELKRFGHRNSCKPLHIFQMTEKLAMAGVINQTVYAVAASILIEHKGLSSSSSSVSKLVSGDFSLLAERPLLGLWRYASRQKKHGRQIDTEIFQEESDSESERERESDGDEEGEEICLSSGSDIDRYSDIDLHTSPGEVSSQVSRSIAPPDSEVKESVTATAQSSLYAADTNEPFPSLSISSLFSDCTRPLVLDLGCGYGVQLLALASSHRLQQGHLFGQPPYHETKNITTSVSATREIETKRESETRRCIDEDIYGETVNYLGCDMDPMKVAFANSISRRWGVRGHCAFIECDVENMVQRVAQEYPGPVCWVMLNFPTPYSSKLLELGDKEEKRDKETVSDRTAVHSRIEERESKLVRERNKEDCRGNSQLPEDLEDFMVTRSLLEKTLQLLQPKDNADLSKSCKIDDRKTEQSDLYKQVSGCLYLQSNVEDVAVTMRDVLLEVIHSRGYSVSLPSSSRDIPWLPGWEDFRSDSKQAREEEALWVSSEEIKTEGQTLSRRQRVWRAAGGTRAVGEGWLVRSPLPVYARTETEIMCQLNQKDVHRILYIVH
eukprot:CAMPEP_0182421666 /NCGR_PEP_ID=MMETSP1167-20130531/7111_1 /TAXON_ID=2988 /ORGANISM="Mallomonas Sp, Strain CCMP3275" /LENGTH=713 /DNA_ID=CAMNT_0024599015 /DNA_START=674 /DNA_END=2815 /DNA_ORIENTATION=+